MAEHLSLSATEAGLLTVAERRGKVSAARSVDHHEDPTAVERSEMLIRLCDRGLLAQDALTDAEIAYVITPQGRAALAALDALRGP